MRKKDDIFYLCALLDQSCEYCKERLGDIMLSGTIVDTLK